MFFYVLAPLLYFKSIRQSYMRQQKKNLQIKCSRKSIKATRKKAQKKKLHPTDNQNLHTLLRKSKYKFRCNLRNSTHSVQTFHSLFSCTYIHIYEAISSQWCTYNTYVEPKYLPIGWMMVWCVNFRLFSIGQETFLLFPSNILRNPSLRWIQFCNGLTFSKTNSTCAQHWSID